jgi:hypothetical protein
VLYGSRDSLTTPLARNWMVLVRDVAILKRDQPPTDELRSVDNFRMARNSGIYVVVFLPVRGGNCVTADSGPRWPSLSGLTMDRID